MKSVFLFSVFIFLSGFSANHIASIHQEPVVSAEQLKKWVSYLASDQMRGRKNGSPEMQEAAKWLASKFEEMGLSPFNEIGGYIQNYSYSSRQNELNERNVIGYLEGSDPVLKNQYLILSAHYDHIGTQKGNTVDSIYNGADDNAAGTATLLGIAKTIQLSGMRPGRSIIFAAFSGEENGMRGSRYFVAHSPVPMNRIDADINFEMTGHSEYLGKRNYYMTGCLNSDLDDVIKSFDEGSGYQLIDTIAVANNLFYASDNIAFSRISVSEGITTGIPSGTFATTALAGYIHSPSDEIGLFDFENMADLVSHFSKMIIRLSNIQDEIKWTNPKFVRPR